MTRYKSYMHVERLNEEACEGLLENKEVYVTAKIDGTNSCVWLEDGEICCGNRKRKISLSDENGRFMHWFTSSNCEEVTLIRNYLEDNPDNIIYGEFLGTKKFLGSIKQYNSSALSKLWIFDVYSTSEDSYIPDNVWREELSKYGLSEYIVPVLAVLNNPSYDEVAEVASNNKFLLDNSELTGEGVVCKVPNWKNKFGEQVYGKIVLDEYKQNKRKSHKVALTGDVEFDIVNVYITESELSKTMEKVCVANNVDKFDKKSSKMVGMFISMTLEDLLSECPNWSKRLKYPTVDFSLLRWTCNQRARDYLGI